MDASPPSEWHSAPSPPPPATPDERRERPQPGNANVPVLVGGIAAELAATTRASVSAVKTVPASFWLYALSGTCMYRRVLYTGSHTTAFAW